MMIGHTSSPARSFASRIDDTLRQAIEMDITNGRLQGAIIKPNLHPEFHQAVHALAKRANLKEAPMVVVLKNMPFGPVWANNLPSAAALPGTVVLNDSIMHLTNASVHAKPSAQLEGILAHEFSHLKDGFAKTLLSRLSPFALPIAAMAALHLYDKAHKQTSTHGKHSKKELADTINKTADAEIETLRKEADNSVADQESVQADRNWAQQYVNAGRYLAVAALGAGTGLLIARKHSLAVEYRADRLAAEIANPEAFKTALINLHASIDNFWQSPAAKEITERKFMKNILAVVESTLHAHPSLIDRLTFIDRVANERQMSAALQM